MAHPPLPLNACESNIVYNDGVSKTSLSLPVVGEAEGGLPLRQELVQWQMDFFNKGVCAVPRSWAFTRPSPSLSPLLVSRAEYRGLDFLPWLCLDAAFVVWLCKLPRC
jgi:hypothetical protein